jgi:hypothetical protein
VRTLVAAAVLVLAVLFAPAASAQMGGMGGMGRPGGGQQSGPTQSGPVQHRQVGPRAGAGANDEGDVQVQQRVEPVILPPADPLAISPEVKERLGSDYMGGPPSPVGETHRSFHFCFPPLPCYEERRGDYRFRMSLPPLAFSYTRGLQGERAVPGEPTKQDSQYFALLYYGRRSPDLDMDTVFPAFWRVRDRQNHVVVAGPLVHREAPGEHDNWLAPLYFEGLRKDGGYLHIPALLTTSHWGPKSAFTLVGPYFRDRTDTDVDWGVAPFVFHGDNGNTEGGRKTYTLIPPAFYYHHTSEIDESTTTVVGPALSTTSAKRDVLDVFPLYYSIRGNPQTGGIRESHTTLFPFFHYGVSDDASLFVIPGYLRRVTKTADTLLTPLYSRAETRNGASSLTLVGPIIPLYAHYRDRDTNETASLYTPFYFGYDSPTSRSFLTPLVGRFEQYGESRTWWVFPSFVTTSDTHGWDFNLYPVFFAGRSDDTSHTVIAPVFWDFASPRGRTTIAAPLFWRFADTSDDSITQVAANTLYRQKRVADGLEWEFHVLPLFSYGANPQGYWWNVLFGLAGYDREGSYARIKAFYIPITVSGAPATAAAARQSAFGW